MGNRKAGTVASNIPTKSLSNLLGTMKTAGRAIGNFASNTLTAAKAQIKRLLTSSDDSAKNFKKIFAEKTGFKPKAGSGVGDAELEFEAIPGMKRGQDGLPDIDTATRKPKMQDNWELVDGPDGLPTAKPKDGFKADPANPDGPAITVNTPTPRLGATQVEASGVNTNLSKKLEGDVDISDFDKRIKQLEKDNAELSKGISDLNLKKSDLETTISGLKKSPPEVQAKAEGLFSGKNIAIAAGAILYFAHKKKKEEAEENRKKCKELCKPEGFEYWKAGTVQLAQLSDTTIEGTPQLFKDECGDDNICWNQPDTEISTVTCSEQTVTASNCETICNSHCNDTYPIPSIADTVEGIANGDVSLSDAVDGALDTAEDLTKDISEPFLDRFKEMFSFLGDIGTYVAYFFAGILICVGLYFGFKFLVAPMLKSKSKSTGGGGGQPTVQVINPASFPHPLSQ
jgi:hypothetical protein